MAFQILINGIVLGSVFAVVSFGYALIYNTTRIFHIAYASIFTAAPYFMFFFKETLKFSLPLSFLLSIPATMALSLCVEFFVYRPLSKRESSPAMIMISSIGAMVIIVNTISILFGSEAKTVTLEISRAFQFGGILLTYNQILQLSLSAILLLVSLSILKYSKFGLMIRAFRDDEMLFSVLGKDGYQLRTILFPLSGLFAAVSSGLVSLDIGFTPFIGMPMLLHAVVALIIGGVGRFASPVLGGLIMGVLQALAALVFATKWQEGVTFAVMIIFLLFRPQGILGERFRKV